MKVLNRILLLAILAIFTVSCTDFDENELKAPNHVEVYDGGADETANETPPADSGDGSTDTGNNGTGKGN